MGLNCNAYSLSEEPSGSRRRYLRSLQTTFANPTESRLSIRFSLANAGGPKHLMLSMV